MTITREQVERATDAAYDCNAQGVYAALGAEWYKDPRIPSDVLAGWRETGYTSLYRALTSWRDELAAAEPIDDTAPERLRERRERADAAQAARMQRDAADYAAALSAEEERRGAQLLADEEARAEAFHAEPERPAPRFKVGDWVRVVTGPLSAGRDRAIQVTHLTSGYIHADGLPWADWQIEPAAPPAPDVVDVPQPDHLAYADSPVWDDGPLPTPTPVTSLYVIVCDSGQYDYARTDVVCVTCTERAAERTCRDANAILSSGSEAADAVEVAHYHDPDDTDHDAFMERLSAVKRPFAKRLAVVVGAHFEAAFSGDETMRAVRAEYCPRFKKGGAS